MTRQIGSHAQAPLHRSTSSAASRLSLDAKADRRRESGGAARRGRACFALGRLGWLGRLGALGTIGLVAWTLGAASAQAGSPRLVRLTPPGGQRGTTVEVHFTGRFLDRPEEVIFYEPGITAGSIEMVEGEIVTNGRKERVEPGTRVRVMLTVAPDCSLGPHGLRFRTANGLTDYQRFFVGPFPTIEEDEQTQLRNDKLEQAKPVATNSTVLGRMNDPTDVDLFRVEIARGGRISAEIEAARLGTERGLPDLHLSILDADGKPLASADDSALFLQDPVLSIRAERDGPFYVAVRHSTYSAANEIYRLHVGDFVRPTAIYPAGGQSGEELTVQIIGDPRGEWTQKVKLPNVEPAAGSRDFAFAAVDQNVSAPTPNTLRVSPWKNVLEAEPNDTAETLADANSAGAGSPTVAPAVFNGIIGRPGDVDYFRFEAKKGDRFRVRALANAIGSPLDPTLTITAIGPKPGAPVRAADSRPNQLSLPPVNGAIRETLDPVIDFTVPADGAYLLRVEDDRGEGSPSHVYRVEFEPETDAVLTYIPQEPENRLTPQARQAINVPTGGRYNTSVSIFNTNRAYSGDLELVAVGLPEGVKMHAPIVNAATPRVPVVFEAEAGVPLQGRLIDIVARPVAADPASVPLASGFRQVVSMNGYGNNDFYLNTVVDKLALAVTDASPFTLEVDPPKSALVQNGEMGIKFRVNRLNGYDGAVTVSMEWRPTGVTASTPITVKPDQSEGEFLISAGRTATAGDHAVVLTCVSGSERPGYYDNANRTFVSSQMFPLKVAEPHVEARLPRSSIERGKTATVTIKLNHLRPFAGTAKATLGRLPRGVQLVESTRDFTADDKELTFTLKATDECLVGSYTGVVLDVTVQEDGQAVRQLSGSGMLRIDAERGAPRKQ